MLATCHAWTISRHSIQSHWGHTQIIKPREVEADHRSFISPRPKCILWDSPTSSLTCIRVDEVANKAAQVGKGGARVNISETYRMVPVHSDDKHLLGINWNGQVAILTLHSHLVYAVIFSYSFSRWAAMGITTVRSLICHPLFGRFHYTWPI